MGLDIRIPLGVMFTTLGLLLTGFGFVSDPAIYPPPEVRARLFLPTEFDFKYQRLRTRTWTRIKSGL